MSDRTIVITGASDGIGAAAARQLVANGERVVLVGRSPEKTARLATELAAPQHVADFAELDQVRSLAVDLLDSYPRIDVLANNAGGVFGRETTADGFDKTLQVNHLAPFLLTHLLMDRLIDSGASIIQTSSVAARMYGNLDLDDLDNASAWSANKAYGDSKLENILFTKELQHRFGDRGINAVAFHPGTVATNFASDTSSWFKFVYRTPLSRVLLVSQDKGGEALTWLIEGTPGQTWIPGEYYSDNKVAATAAQAADAQLANDLWERSAAMVGVPGA